MFGSMPIQGGEEIKCAFAGDRLHRVSIMLSVNSSIHGLHAMGLRRQMVGTLRLIREEKRG